MEEGRSEFADGFPKSSLVTTVDSGLINGDSFTTWLRYNFQAHRVACLCHLLLDGHASRNNFKL